MARFHRFFIAAAAATVLGLGGCGGSSGTGSGPAAGGGISGTGRAARGTVTDKGSLEVRDKLFDTALATFEVEDVVNPTLDDIKLGMVVEIQGEVVDGVTVANLVRTEEALNGPVGSVVSATEMVVLGQTVIRDVDTALEDFDTLVTISDFTDLDQGDTVEVHGAVGDEIRATYVKRRDPANPPAQYKLKGFIESVAGSELLINGYRVDFSGADVSDLPASVPAAGQFVEVKFNRGSEPVAAKVELDTIDLPNDFLGELRIEGTVTDTSDAGIPFALGDPFSVGGQGVQTDLSTVFVGGLPADLIEGSVVEAEGQFQSGGFLAFKVKFKDAVRLESDVTSNNGTTVELVHLNGIAVTADEFTEVTGDVSTFADITTAHHVKVRGRKVGTSGATVVASLIEADAVDLDRNDVDLQGPVEAFADPTLVILGVTVDTTTTATEFLDPDDFQDQDDVPIGRAEFFGRLAVGDLVKAQGKEDEAPFLWDEVELEE